METKVLNLRSNSDTINVSVGMQTLYFRKIVFAGIMKICRLRKGMDIS